jgi:hypothetical protein
MLQVSGEFHFQFVVMSEDWRRSPGHRAQEPWFIQEQSGKADTVSGACQPVLESFGVEPAFWSGGEGSDSRRQGAAREDVHRLKSVRRYGQIVMGTRVLHRAEGDRNPLSQGREQLQGSAAPSVEGWPGGDSAEGKDVHRARVVFWEVEASRGFLSGRGHSRLDLGPVWDLRLHLSDTDPRGLIDLNSAIQ